MHPLDGAYERVNGAREHLDTLKPLIRDFSQEVSKGVTLNYKMGVSIVRGQKRRVPIGNAKMTQGATPPRISRLIGEVVQNLRTALDYLVYELARFDAKTIVENTQFVIVDSEKDFQKNLWHLRGLTGEHIAAFKRLQPFDGCQWTKRIADLSNPDKHCHLTIVKSPVIVAIDPRITQAILAGEHVNVNDYATISITFSDGLPAIENLEQLVLRVGQTLDNFKPEFK
jgi:hypothetical protein